MLGYADFAPADELTLQAEQNLANLGYETGAVDGEETVETVIAISKIQAKSDLEVVGEVTPQLAGALAAAVAGANAGDMPVSSDSAVLQAAQQACLQKNMQDAQAASKPKRGLGRLRSHTATEVDFVLYASGSRQSSR